jgi:hypothetical protein
MASYSSSIHALKHLLSISEATSYKCRIRSKVSENVSYLINGVEYSFVEVTCDDGMQYGLQAYGDEAIELHKEALKHSSKEEKEEEGISIPVNNIAY